jgi:nitroimidazol reductase NimA-like FMN-containing flavoprotein (pyridoxamine 5'-phosphate oxidase superfamily)
MTTSSGTKVQRHPERGRYDRDLIHAILDDGFLCHVGFVQDGQPFVIPTLYTRIGGTLYLHGSPVSRMLRFLQDGIPMCVTVTLVDGIVLARSAFSSSVNYRSVVVLGQGSVVTDEEDKRAAMRALVDQVMPGRSDDAREPNEKELAATLVIDIPLEEASAKVRIGPPKDAAGDYGLKVWAGEIPLSLRVGEPVPDPQLASDIPVPPYVRRFSGPQHTR